MLVNARLHRRTLRLEAGGGPGQFRAKLPAGAAGAWCRFAVGLEADEPWWAKLEVADDDRCQVVREAFLGRLHGKGATAWRSTLVHMPAISIGLTVQIFTASGKPAGIPRATLTVLARPVAALSLLAHGWRRVPRALAGQTTGLPWRLRTMLGHAPAQGGDVPPYTVWVKLYDRWGPAERDALALHRPGQTSIAVVVVGSDHSGAATLADLDKQWLQPVRVIRLTRPTDYRAGAEAWLLVLQAGERVPPHALACFAHAALLQPNALGFYADADVISHGARASPLFKPQADPWLLGSGLLTAGACLFRTDLAVSAATPPDAVAWRQSMALSAGPVSLTRVPLILTHLTGPAPVFRTPHYHSAGATLPSVSVVIPSAAQSAHVLRCVRQLIATTNYPSLEILMAVSHRKAGSALQTRTMTALGNLPGVRVIDLDMESFNYAAVNNAAVRQATGDLLLFLNDDVVPVQCDWLKRMVVHIESLADIVGARLLYGNDTVQHGGVIVGLANLCEHAFRLTPRHHAGPYGIALLNRQVSAVTGACMLLRRSLYGTLGGMDESFAVALNDVDFCLRAVKAGARIVLAAEVELYHYESRSLGRHYEGSRAQLEAVEVTRLRKRWTGVLADDPFYSPNASLIPGHEFQPGFPPRCSPMSWINGESPLCA